MRCGSTPSRRPSSVEEHRLDIGARRRAHRTLGEQRDHEVVRRRQSPRPRRRSARDRLGAAMRLRARRRRAATSLAASTARLTGSARSTAPRGPLHQVVRDEQPDVAAPAIATRIRAHPRRCAPATVGGGDCGDEHVRRPPGRPCRWSRPAPCEAGTAVARTVGPVEQQLAADGRAGSPLEADLPGWVDPVVASRSKQPAQPGPWPYDGRTSGSSQIMRRGRRSGRRARCRRSPMRAQRMLELSPRATSATRTSLSPVFT